MTTVSDDVSIVVGQGIGPWSLCEIAFLRLPCQMPAKSSAGTFASRPVPLKFET